MRCFAKAALLIGLGAASCHRAGPVTAGHPGQRLAAERAVAAPALDTMMPVGSITDGTIRYVSPNAAIPPLPDGGVSPRR